MDLFKFIIPAFRTFYRLQPTAILIWDIHSNSAEDCLENAENIFVNYNMHICVYIHEKSCILYKRISGTAQLSYLLDTGFIA
jgi:hypothetical protein